jgi:endonuclease G
MAARQRKSSSSSRKRKSSRKPKGRAKRSPAIVSALLIAVAMAAAAIIYLKQPPERQGEIKELLQKQLQKPKRFNAAELSRQLWLLFHRDAVVYEHSEHADANDGSQHIFGGIPVPTTEGRELLVLHNLGYSVGYDEARKNPAWVAYRLFSVPADTSIGERPRQFNVDPRSSAQVRSADYTGSGFDRGHLAPNYAIARCYGPLAQVQTFLMTNIAPQRHALNAGVWKNLEMLEANDYAQKYEEIWVICGTIFSPHRLRELPSGVPIPESFFKIVLDEQHGTLRILAFIFSQNSNNKTAVSDGLCCVDDIEAATGLDFFPDLPPEIQEQLESIVPKSLW